MVAQKENTDESWSSSDDHSAPLSDCSKRRKDKPPFHPETAVSANSNAHMRRLSNSIILDSLSMAFSQGSDGDFDISLRDSTVGTNDGQPAMETQLAQRETRAVNCIRFVLLTLMFVVACAFAAAVFVYTSNQETDDFEETFRVFSQQIIDTVQTMAQNRLEAVGALAFQMQAYAYNSNSSWPFVTVPFFEESVHSMKSLTDAFSILLFPIVPNELRAEWEEYSLENRRWMNESYAAQEYMVGESGEVLPATNETWFDVLWGPDYENYNNPDFSSGISNRIFGGWDPNNDTISGPFVYPESDLFFPQWHAAPFSWYYQSTVNQHYGQFDDFLNSTILSIETGHAVLGIAWNDGVVPGFITTMLYPIYEEIHPESNKDESIVVAFLGADIYWRDYLSDILPSTAEGVTVVIENNVDQTFTYRIDGPNVTFIGEGDRHDRSYDSLEETFVFGEHLGPSGPPSSYSGAPLNPVWVKYAIHVFPSAELEDSYRSFRPAVYTVVVLLVALMAAVIFMLYNFLVERRQKLVLRTAVQSDAIVSSLFPSKVKERLYQNNVSDKKGIGASGANAIGIEHPMSSTSLDQEPSMTAPASSDLSTLDEGKTSDLMDLYGARKLDGPPIAELYENATVFFADMVGFTAWSSERPPADVFTLLETCFGAFDVIAKRRGIFKIETIGDCYVAVSGLPVKRDDHAVVMAKFARDMLETMSKEVAKLVPVLGSATASLAMRVGMHSGPVTAGVLRGERARFQLFGDTVNTAARMESTSVRNRIQLSEATAQLIMEAGKESWLVKRDGEVDAKGKGMMQTYWLKCNVKSSMQRPSQDHKQNLEPVAETPLDGTIEVTRDGQDTA